MTNFYLLKNYLNYRCLSKFSRHASGFTLTELLVTIIIGGLIVTGVTAIMTDIVRASKEEEVRTSTQQDMQRALKFLEADLKSATYIYTGEEIRNRDRLSTSISDHLEVNDDFEIVLAFWKPEVIPYTPAGPDVPRDCDDGSGNLNSNLNAQGDADAKLEECQDLQTQRRTYTLVVYVQETDPSDTWSGESIIRRYDLRKYDTDETYTSNGTKYLDLTVESTYVDPIKQANGFRDWPYDSNGDNLQDNPGSAVPVINGNTALALVDFVDDPNRDTGNLPTCSDGYSRTPSASQSTSFFACVRESSLDGEVSEGNQDVVLYLRGNPDGRSGYQIASNSYTPLPTLKTRVLLRGVVDKLYDN